MAAGDITLDAGNPRSIMGGRRIITGTIEVDETYRAFAIGDTLSYIDWCYLMPEDGVGSAEIDLNVNASGTATNGTIAVVGNDPAVMTFRFTAALI